MAIYLIFLDCFVAFANAHAPRNDDILYITLDLYPIRATNRNRSICSVAFVFVKIFGIETRLKVCEIPKSFTSAKLHTQRQIAKAINAIFSANPSIYLVTDKLNDFSAIENQLNFGKDRIIIEIFALRDYFRARKMGFKYAMFSTSDIAFAMRHKIPFIAIHTSAIQSESGAKLAREYIKNGGCIFAYSSNESAFINAHKGKSVSAFYTDYYDINADKCKLSDKSKCETY